MDRTCHKLNLKTQLFRGTGEWPKAGRDSWEKEMTLGAPPYQGFEPEDRAPSKPNGAAETGIRTQFRVASAAESERRSRGKQRGEPQIQSINVAQISGCPQSMCPASSKPKLYATAERSHHGASCCPLPSL